MFPRLHQALPADMNLNERKTVQVYDDFMFSVCFKVGGKTERERDGVNFLGMKKKQLATLAKFLIIIK